MQNYYMLAIAILVSILVFLVVIFKNKYQLLFRVFTFFKELPNVIAKWKDLVSFNESLEIVGYAYDPFQDIFYSILYPWQRSFGYCRLYDEAAAPLGMIIDCEPIYFEYGEKKWLIEFWKGQYDLTTGSEVGVYTAKGPNINIPGVFSGTFYDCAEEEDFLKISYILKKNGKKLFKRKGKHWWLTGFKLGEFSEPEELSMYINITLKDRVMRNVFLKGLENAEYSENEIEVNGNTVSLLFGRPHTLQPTTRTKATDAVIQMKNKLLCDQYQIITAGYSTPQDKFNAVLEKAPDLYGHITGLGKTKQLYSLYETIKNLF